MKIKSKCLRLHQYQACKHHDDVIKWKQLPPYWPFVRGVHRAPVNSPHKGQWGGALMFSLICAWTNNWANHRDTGDFRRHRTHYDITIKMSIQWTALHFSLQVRYGTHWAATHPNDVAGGLTEILLDEDEVLTEVAAFQVLVIDNIQFISNMRSFPKIGSNDDFNAFISATELVYFSGSQYPLAGLRVSRLVAMALTCSTN